MHRSTRKRAAANLKIILKRGELHIDTMIKQHVHMFGPVERIPERRSCICLMLKEVIVALVTLFHEDGSVNFDKLKEILNGMWKTERMVFGSGTTGESSTMTQ